MKHSVKHSTTEATRRSRGPARRIGRSLALVLPVLLVLSGTLAVTRVSWSGSPDSSMLTAADTAVSDAKPAAPRAPHEVLRDKLLAEVQDKDPGVALTHLQEAVNARPSLAEHCTSIARSLGHAAVRIYGSTRAQAFARPVCDTSYATGVVAAHG